MTEPAPAAIDSTAAMSELISKPVEDSGLRRFVPTDGIFLSAPHLDQMRIYAEEFALVAGVSAGSGVDHGLNVTTDQKILVVSPGLAVNQSRQPLRLSTETEIPLTLEPDATKLWIIEIEAAPRIPAGQEPNFGSLCDDPAGSAPLAPWSDAAVRIKVRPVGESGQRRLREGSGPQSGGLGLLRRRAIWREAWLPPPKGKPLVGFPWNVGFPKDPPKRDGDDAVPIAALLWDGSKWVVDTWIARRDIGGAPSRAASEGHLGLRPWNVFVAQVLQFQAHLAEYVKAGVAKSRRTSSEFVELPPAGAVPLPEKDREDPAKYFRTFFNTDLPLEVEYTRADCALRALEQAQHLDRIRLKESNDYSYVRLLVPTVGDGDGALDGVRPRVLPAGRGRDIPARRSRRHDPQDSPQSQRTGSADDLVATLQYPRGGWAVPGPRGALDLIRDEDRRARRDKGSRACELPGSLVTSIHAQSVARSRRTD